MKVRIVEVGPRDGLQNEKGKLPAGEKAAFVDALAAAGLGEIEAGAFVSPRWVPQMADTDEVFRLIHRRPGVVYSALVPNEIGFEGALAAGADRVAVFTAASETFSRKNVNATITESIERFRPVLKRAGDAGIPVRGYVSTAFHCPYEGRVEPARVVEVVARLEEIGVEELSIGDTIGKATEEDMRALLEELLAGTPADRLALHLHDTHGNATGNALAALREFGITRFDASAGGLGGCPYAPGAPGNVATETLVRALEGAGAETGVDAAAVERAAREARKRLAIAGGDA